jgi:hypothetical protein
METVQDITQFLCGGYLGLGFRVYFDMRTN